MSPNVIYFIQFVAIGIFGFVIYKSPQSFMGRAKFDEGAVKTQELLSKAGIGIMIMCTIAIVYKSIKILY